MDTVPATQESLSISQGKLLTFVRAMLDGGRVDDDNPLPPGPWDPVVRDALERVGLNPLEPWTPHSERLTWKLILSIILKAHPEIEDTVHGGHHFLVGGASALVPPRYLAMLSIAKTVTARAESIHEFAVMANGGEQQPGPDAGTYLAKFSEHICGSEVRPRWPFPGPPPDWFNAAINGIDLAIMAAQFERAARDTFDANLRQQLQGTAGRLAEAGVAMMG